MQTTDNQEESLQEENSLEENPQEEKIKRKIIIPRQQSKQKEGVISEQLSDQYLDNLEQKFDQLLVNEEAQQSFEQLVSESSPFFKENDLLNLSPTKQIFEQIKRKNPLIVDFVELLLTAKVKQNNSQI